MAGAEDESGVREEFLSEAQEIVETLSRDLLLLEQSQKEGRSDPDLLNDIFRAVHTLKGLAGMFGLPSLQTLAHTLENLLDDLRLGRVDLTQETLDILFDGIERIQRILASDDEAIAYDISDLEKSIDRVADAAPEARDQLRDYELGDSVLSVLTEYEEHRLRQNVAQGLPLYRLRVSFGLASIDTALEELKSRARSLAELITYLPSMGGGDEDVIDLEVLLASASDIEALREALCTGSAVLEAVPRRAGAGRIEPERPKPALPPPAHGAASSRQPAAAPRARSTELAPAEKASEPTDADAVADKPGPRTQAPGPAQGSGLDRVGADALSLRSVANTVRVNIQKLDHLMNVVGELAIVRSAVSQITERLRTHPELRYLSTELHRIARGFERNLTELQDGILDVRMVPLGQVFDKLARVVRQAARDARKEIKLEVKGNETEVDKLIVEELSDPLMHLIRNAIDHGIESADDRVALGKPAHGVLSLMAYQKGNHVVIEVTDDGAGMDPAKLRRRAIERGIVGADEAHEMSRDDMINLIFVPGFSTTDRITDLSGRGVGMDVVKTNISKLGGVIDIRSEVGKGTTIVITLPITLAIISALVIRVGGQTYAIPLANVQEALLLEQRAIRTVEGREVMTLRGGTLPLCRIRELFKLGENLEVGRASRQFVVVSQLGARRIGLVVDLLLGQQDIVIKALGKSLRNVRGFVGATDLGDQSVTLVLDTPQILEEVLAAGDRRGAEVLQ
ncbi:MAG: CheA signal transduction histidine kinase [Myxococcaceae bacterium]|nr:CheA signal transduction histidine kinase [Myxococcaceae bacterium]